MLLRPAMRGLMIAAIVVSIVLPREVLGAGIEKRVVFPRGKTTVSYRDARDARATV